MEATIILAKCGKTGLSYGMRVQKLEDGDWWRTWAFPISEQQLKNEGYDKTTVCGNLFFTDEYPGCPYCGGRVLVQCSCGKLSCWNSQQSMKCSWCGRLMDNIYRATSKMSFSGGNM